MENDKKEFCLSDKSNDFFGDLDEFLTYSGKDVKEFIKRLSEGLPMTTLQAEMKSKDYWKGVNDMIERAKELAGEKLI